MESMMNIGVGWEKLDPNKNPDPESAYFLVTHATTRRPVGWARPEIFTFNNVAFYYIKWKACTPMIKPITGI